jgi:SpoIIAA-like
MSAEIIDNSGNTLTVRISGLLKQPELAALQQAVGDVLGKQGKTRLLILTEAFEGWQRGGAWGDVSFSAEHDKHIEKMAIVGDRKWEDLALMFASKGLRRFPIEYFPSAETARARRWLAEATPESSSP